MKKRYTFLPKNWLRLGLATAFVASFSLNLQAQTGPIKQWDKTFGGNKSEILSSLQQTNDGGYILGGYSYSGISGDKTEPNRYTGSLTSTCDYWIVKLNANGTKLWDKTFGGTNDEIGTLLQQTTDGGYIIGGSSKSALSGDKTQNPFGGYDYWVIKLDANGNKVWDKVYGGTSDEYFTSLQQTTDGGYIIGGYSISTLGGSKTEPNKDGFSAGPGTAYDYWILKLDANGNKVWDKTIGGTLNDELQTIQQTPDGGFILGGESESNINGDKTQISRGGKDYWVVKLSANGVKLWDRTFGGNYAESFSDLQQTLDGGFLIGGYTMSGITGEKTEANKGGQDYWVLKLDANGNKVWDKAFGGSLNETLTGINQNTDGTYMLSGVSNSGISMDKSQASLGSIDYWVVKIGATGLKIWDLTLGGSLGDAVYSFWNTSDGGYILGGLSHSGISGDKTEINKGPTSTSDYWIVKLGPDVLSIKEPETNFTLSISPNPNQGKFNLKLSNLSASKTEVTISDLLGRVVLQKEIQTTNNQLSEELTLPNAKGMYLLRLKTGEQILTRKIIVE